MKFLILNETGPWNDDPRVLGVFSNYNAIIPAVFREIHNHGRPELSDDDLKSLLQQGQTQGREVNYQVKEVTLDELI